MGLTVFHRGRASVMPMAGPDAHRVSQDGKRRQIVGPPRTVLAAVDGEHPAAPAIVEALLPLVAAAILFSSAGVF